jgi:hypothetical protein
MTARSVLDINATYKISVVGAFQTLAIISPHKYTTIKTGRKKREVGLVSQLVMRGFSFDAFGVAGKATSAAQELRVQPNPDHRPFKEVLPHLGVIYSHSKRDGEYL